VQNAFLFVHVRFLIWRSGIKPFLEIRKFCACRTFSLELPAPGKRLEALYTKHCRQRKIIGNPAESDDTLGAVGRHSPPLLEMCLFHLPPLSRHIGRDLELFAQYRCACGEGAFFGVECHELPTSRNDGEHQRRRSLCATPGVPLFHLACPPFLRPGRSCRRRRRRSRRADCEHWLRLRLRRYGFTLTIGLVRCLRSVRHQSREPVPATQPATANEFQRVPTTE
jgi:hypothetical protein